MLTLVRRQETVSRSYIAEALQRTGSQIAAYGAAMECIQAHARVVIHFHPDRVGIKSIPVVSALLKEGVYRNQFETGLSTGSLSAFPGGARDSWERVLFGDAYHGRGVSHSERPKYGALELVRYADGPIPRFGSCYFVMRPAVSRRTSFTFTGSEDLRATERIGVIGEMDNVMAALFEEIEAGGMASPPWPPFRAPTLGLSNLTVPKLLDVLKDLASPRTDTIRLPTGRVLDTQIEAQVHGPIDLQEDIELLVADPAFAPTHTGKTLHELALRYGFPLRWHRGFRLAVGEVPADFRGPAMPRLAGRIAGGNGMIDAAVIGAAEASLHDRPELWRDWGTREELLQHLKQLWHVLVHYGAPAHHTMEGPR
ncbi:hypothetical protein W02_17940 [Nitrospira sp. KM1]|nr:hypothetical protein W02_17940 [Nitrospira sp. KM1]